MKKRFYHADNLDAVIILCVILLLICFAVTRFVTDTQSATRPGSSCKPTEREKNLSLVNWGTLGDSDEEAERTLNAFFGD